MTIGTLSLSPSFSPDVLSYTASTGNKTNAVTAKAEDGAIIDITLDNANGNGLAVTNGSAVTWADGENVLAIAVTDGDAETALYTVVVTKS